MNRNLLALRRMRGSRPSYTTYPPLNRITPRRDATLPNARITRGEPSSQHAGDGGRAVKDELGPAFPRRRRRVLDMSQRNAKDENDGTNALLCSSLHPSV